MAGSQVEVALTQIEKQRLGYQAISLTNFDNDSEPQIAAGSKVEIGGALFEFTSNESITGWGSIGNDNDVYIKLVVSGTSVTAEFTTTAPTWSTSKQGWYDSLDRYVGGLYKDGSGNYTAKWLYVAHRKEPVLRDSGTESIGATSAWYPPPGFYNFAPSVGNVSAYIYVGGSWRSISTYGQMIFCDGENMRWYNNDSSAHDLYWQRIYIRG